MENDQKVTGASFDLVKAVRSSGVKVQASLSQGFQLMPVFSKQVNRDESDAVNVNNQYTDRPGSITVFVDWR